MNEPGAALDPTSTLKIEELMSNLPEEHHLHRHP
jgi:ABC-type phosphate transport system ATPase subunit